MTFSVQGAHRLLLGWYGNYGSRESAGALIPHTEQLSAATVTDRLPPPPQRAGAEKGRWEKGQQSRRTPLPGERTLIAAPSYQTGRVKSDPFPPLDCGWAGRVDLIVLAKANRYFFHPGCCKTRFHAGLQPWKFT